MYKIEIDFYEFLGLFSKALDWHFKSDPQKVSIPKISSSLEYSEQGSQPGYDRLYSVILIPEIHDKNNSISNLIKVSKNFDIGCP